MSRFNTVKTGYKYLMGFGTAVGFGEKYHEGYSGKKFNLFDVGPQALFKFAGRIHHGNNQFAQMQGRHETQLHTAKLKRQLQIDSQPTAFEMAEKRIQRAKGE